MTTTKSAETEAVGLTEGEIKICILEHVGRGPAPGKVFTLGADGKYIKTPIGSRERFMVGDFMLTLKDLHATLIGPLAAKYHLTGGSCGHTVSKDAGDNGAVAVTEAELNRVATAGDPFTKLEDPDSKRPLIGFGDDHLKRRPGAGLMLIDTDGRQKTPVSVQLMTAVPGIEAYARIEAPSSSSFIYDKAGNRLSELEGLHTHFGAVDATDIPRALVIIHRRLILSGFSQFKLSRKGDILERSAADLAMKKPSQPIFAGAATMKDGLVSKRAEYTKYFAGKPLLDTRALIRDLTPAEEREYATKVAEARETLREDAARVKAAYIEEQAAMLAKNSGGQLSLEDARGAANRSIDGGFLPLGHEIMLLDGRIVTVADILTNPDVYHGKKCRDPHDWNYGSGTVAIIYTRRSKGEPCVFSYAHGEHRYTLGEPKTAVEDFSTPEAEAALNDPVTQKIIADAVAAAFAGSTPPWVHEMNRDFALLAGSGSSSAKSILRFKAGDWSLEDYLSVKRLLANRTIHVGDNADGSAILKPIFPLWERHPSRRTYADGLKFQPGQPRTFSGTFNTWDGWGVAPVLGPWDSIYTHIHEVLCDGDKAVSDYVLNWLALRVQRLHGPMGTVIVFKSEPGVGKGLFNGWLRTIFGKACLTASMPTHVVGQFNVMLRDLLLLFCEEALFSGNHAYRGPLKHLITEPTIMVEAKYVGSQEVPNNIGMIWATNESWAAPVESGDRRYFVIDCAKKRDAAYYTKLAAAAQVELGAFFDALLTRDVSQFRVQDFPRTAARAEQMRQGFEGLDRFMDEMLTRGGWPKGSGHFPGDVFKDWDAQPIIIPKDALRDAVSEFMQKHFRSRRVGDEEIKRAMEAMGGQDIRLRDGKDRQRVWRLPPLGDARDGFSERHGFESGEFAEDDVGESEAPEAPFTKG